MKGPNDKCNDGKSQNVKVSMNAQTTKLVSSIWRYILSWSHIVTIAIYCIYNEEKW